MRKEDFKQSGRRREREKETDIRKENGKEGNLLERERGEDCEYIEIARKKKNKGMKNFI